MQFDDEEEFVHIEEVRDGRRYCYCSVDVPDDLTEDASDRFDIAVNQARELFPDYVSPCWWELVSDDGNTVHIVRVSRA